MSCDVLSFSFISKIQDKDIPIARNQNLVIKTLMSHRAEVVDIAHISETVNPQVAAKRLELLQSKMVCIHVYALLFANIYNIMQYSRILLNKIARYISISIYFKIFFIQYR